MLEKRNFGEAQPGNLLLREISSEIGPFPLCRRLWVRLQLNGLESFKSILNSIHWLKDFCSWRPKMNGGVTE